MTRAACLAVLALALAACGTAPRKASQPAEGPRKPSYYSDDGPPDSVPANLAQIPDAVPRDEPYNRYANKPYTVFGRTYTPVLNKEPTKERGIASWYGKKFHGQKTASGEPYDMFAMTAAHPTLPIPSYAKVTNVKTGQSCVVRINDRGPFHTDRIIDLSYAAASRIGIAAPGSGIVEVERVFASTGAAPVVVATAAPRPPTVETPMVIEDRGLWLQIGAFSSRESADIFREQAARELSWNNEPLDVSPRDGFFRVRLGPYRNRGEADAIAQKVQQTLGYAPTVTSR
ncbi:MAG TPA: septal ring lytic transglycosylase RlpA family protein [Usitatibacter sp.]|nr:septal ring lytic transglycosylase RlpA family protein [Usitatibacter sp.]